MKEMRLIDRDALMKEICGNECGCVCDEECKNAMCNFYDYIMDAPTIEPEARHGLWIPTVIKGLYKCSACNFEQTSNPNQRFCSYCGARMFRDTVTHKSPL